MPKNKDIEAILKYAGERGIVIPPDLLLEIAQKNASQLLVITPEMLPLFTKDSPGAVPAPKAKGLVLSSTGWNELQIPVTKIGKYVGGGGWRRTRSDPLYVEIAGDTMTGGLILAPGTALVDTGPLRFQEGTLLETPVAGSMEFDGTGIYLTPTNHRRFISLASDAMIATTTATTTASTTLWTGITNADELKPYRVYAVTGAGLYTTHDANDRATVTVSMGGTEIVSLQLPAGLVTNQPWHFEVYFTIRTIGVSGTFSSFGMIMGSTGTAHAVVDESAIDTTAANNVVVACEWSDIENSLSLTQCWLAMAD